MSKINMNSESNSILIKSPKILFISFTIVGFISLYFLRLLINPYKTTIEEFIRAKGTLLEIIITLPLVFLYAIVIYSIISYITKVKSIIINEHEIIFKGNFDRKIKIKDIYEIKLIENKKSNENVRIIFLVRPSIVYSLNFVNINEINAFKTLFNLDQITPNVIENQHETKKIYKI